MNDTSNTIVPLNPETPTTPAPRPVPAWAQRRLTGRIAKLPKKVRDRINNLIEDGVSYSNIIDQLGEEGKGITEDMLSKWKGRGYLDWLEERRLTDAMRARYEFAEDLVSEAGPSQASRAVLNTISANLCQLLAQTDPANIRESLTSDSDKFSRFVNAMVRLSEGSVKLDQYYAAEKERQAASAKAKLPPEKRGVSEEAWAIAEAKLNLM